MQSEIIHQGLNLMLYGMGAVFVFLALLVVATTAMSKLVQNLTPAPESAPVSSAPRATAASFNDPKVIAIIEEAIAKHRAG